jgi:hypothetical protein
MNVTHPIAAITSSRDTSSRVTSSRDTSYRRYHIMHILSHLSHDYLSQHHALLHHMIIYQRITLSSHPSLLLPLLLQPAPQSARRHPMASPPPLPHPVPPPWPWVLAPQILQNRRAFGHSEVAASWIEIFVSERARFLPLCWALFIFTLVARWGSCPIALEGEKVIQHLALLALDFAYLAFEAGEFFLQDICRMLQRLALHLQHLRRFFLHCAQPIPKQRSSEVLKRRRRTQVRLGAYPDAVQEQRRDRL